MFACTRELLVLFMQARVLYHVFSMDALNDWMAGWLGKSRLSGILRAMDGKASTFLMLESDVGLWDAIKFVSDVPLNRITVNESCCSLLARRWLHPPIVDFPNVRLMSPFHYRKCFFVKGK